MGHYPTSAEFKATHALVEVLKRRGFEAKYETWAWVAIKDQGTWHQLSFGEAEQLRLSGTQYKPGVIEGARMPGDGPVYRYSFGG